jgi:hypothetical protein
MSLASAGPARSATRSWNNAAGGSAGTATNWTPNGVPASVDVLSFLLSGTRSITFPSATVPTVRIHAYENGIHNVSTDGIHSTDSFNIWGPSGSGVNFTGGTIRSDGVSLGYDTLSYGRLTLRTASGFPPPAPPSLELVDSMQTGLFGHIGGARLEILGGSSFTSAGPAVFASRATSRCTLIVSGRNSIPARFSSFTSTNPIRSTALFGSFGRFVGLLDNGGIVRVAGDAWIAAHPGSRGVFTLGGSTTTFTPLLAAEKTLRIGDSGGSSTGGGGGEVLLYKGSVLVGGNCLLGDLEGNTSAARLHVEGGLFRASGGFTRRAGSNYAHLGGTIHLEGGFIGWPLPTWPVTSAIGSPELWISNGLHTTVGMFEVGRGGAGHLNLETHAREHHECHGPGTRRRVRAPSSWIRPRY